MNNKLLKFHLKNFDYSKINNKAYVKRWYSRLLANYVINHYSSIELLRKVLVKYNKNSFFNVIEGYFEFAIELFESKYNISWNDTELRKNILYDIEEHKCKLCNKTISKNKTFCSNKCSNAHKSNDTALKAKLSNSLKNYYLNADKNDLKSRHDKISHSTTQLYSKLSTSEKQLKCTNNNLRYTSFENQRVLFNNNNVEFLFDEQFYYNNKFLPVKCKVCGYNWNMTKTTTISRKACIQCNKPQKHKTQNEIFDFLYNNNINLKSNDKEIIKPLELDIVVNDSFAIEFNGLLPHSFGPSKIKWYNNKIENPLYHLNKTNLAEVKNIHLFHIFEHEWLDKKKQNIWKSIINNKLHKSSKIYARNCHIKNVNTAEAFVFINDNHLDGFIESSIKLGLYHNEELVQMMTFNNIQQYEIAQLCTKTHLSVIGGVSKLLKHFERMYKPEEITVYSNRRITMSKNNVFEKLSFEFVLNTEPNPFYFKINENTLFHTSSSSEEMYSKGYRKIFDCGHLKYTKKYNKNVLHSNQTIV